MNIKSKFLTGFCLLSMLTFTSTATAVPESEHIPVTAADLGIAESYCQQIGYASCSDIEEEELIAIGRDLALDDYLDTSAISGSGNVAGGDLDGRYGRYSGSDDVSISGALTVCAKRYTNMGVKYERCIDDLLNQVYTVPTPQYVPYDEPNIVYPDYSVEDKVWDIPGPIIGSSGLVKPSIGGDSKTYSPSGSCTSKNEDGDYVGWCESGLNLRLGGY